MKFFYNPDPCSSLTNEEQEDFYCALRNDTKKHINISLDKRVYSIRISIGGVQKKYTVGDNAIAIFESVEWITPSSYFVFTNSKGFLLSKPSIYEENPNVIVEYFE